MRSVSTGFCCWTKGINEGVWGSGEKQFALPSLKVTGVPCGEGLLPVLSLQRRDLVDGEMHKRKIIHICWLAVLFLALCV